MVDKLYSSRMPIEQALAKLSIGDRAELKRWQGRYAKMFILDLGEKQ